MAHNIVLQAYERSLQARAHCLPYNVPLRENPKIIEMIRKVQQMLQQVENSWVEITNGCKKNSAHDLSKC